MLSFIRPKAGMLAACLILVAIGLVACSGDDPVAPAQTNHTPTFPADITQEPAYQTILDMGGTADLLARIPAAEKWGCPPNARLFLAYNAVAFDASAPPDFPVDTGEFFYTGWGLPLGRHTGYGPFTVNFLTLEQFGTTIWTAANGDEVSADWVGVFTAPDQAGVVTYEGSLEFTGGTGAFAGASGSGGYFGDAASFDGEGRIIWYGWLMLDD